MKKYELTNRTKTFYGRTLHQIKAISNFGNVKTGDLGGWIEREKNLSQEGNAWVFDEAWVYDYADVSENALVYGDAIICGDAIVYGDAKIYGTALIRDHAFISGDAIICGDVVVCGDAAIHGGKWEVPPLYIQGSRYPFNVASDEDVRIGCQIHTWEEWHNEYLYIAEEHNAEDILNEYVQYFNLACRLYRHEDCLIVL